MSNICKNIIEITGNKNNLKKIEDILNNNRMKIRIKFFNKLCGDVCHVNSEMEKKMIDLTKKHINKINCLKKLLGFRKPYDLNKAINSKDTQELLRFGAEDIKFNEVEYEINEDVIKIKFKTNNYSPIAFIKQLASKYDVVVKISFYEDFMLGNQTYIIDRNNTQMI